MTRRFPVYHRETPSTLLVNLRICEVPASGAAHWSAILQQQPVSMECLVSADYAVFVNPVGLTDRVHQSHRPETQVYQTAGSRSCRSPVPDNDDKQDRLHA